MPPAAAPQPAAEDAAPVVYDPGVLAQLPMVANGAQPQFVARMQRLYLESNQRALEDIAAALAQDDVPTLLRLLHTMKSSSAQVGAVELSRWRAIANMRCARATRPARTGPASCARPSNACAPPGSRRPRGWRREPACPAAASAPVVLVLASGRGERFRAAGGTTHKLQALLGGRTVLEHTLAAVRDSGLPWHLEDAGHPGMGDSIAAAVRATRGGGRPTWTAPRWKPCYLQAPADLVEVDGAAAARARQRPKDAPAILMLHGFGASLHTWEPWAKALSDRPRAAARSARQRPEPAGRERRLQRHPHHAAAAGAAGPASASGGAGMLMGNSMGGRIAWTLRGARTRTRATGWCCWRPTDSPVPVSTTARRPRCRPAGADALRACRGRCCA
jgi:HPt (histidine-containing phosphotransfer) domain-containing protein